MQVMRQSGGTKHAVTLAANVFRRKPSLVPRGPELNELAHRLDVRRFAEKLLGLALLGRPTEAGGHRIDEHQIGDVQDRELVVHQAERRRLRQRRFRSISLASAPARPDAATPMPSPDRR